MNRWLLTNILSGLLSLAAISLSAQNVQRSTLAISGNSGQIMVADKTYYVSQSIGQASVIGSFIGKPYTVGQGFQQPPNLNNFITDFYNELDVSVYPNPVDKDITITINEVTEFQIYITLYDVAGVVLYNKGHGISRSIQINMALLNPGLYLLRITTGPKNFVSRLVKR